MTTARTLSCLVLCFASALCGQDEAPASRAAKPSFGMRELAAQYEADGDLLRAREVYRRLADTAAEASREQLTREADLLRVEVRLIRSPNILEALPESERPANLSEQLASLAQRTEEQLSGDDPLRAQIAELRGDLEREPHHYREALAHWAESPDIPAAREAYQRLTWKFFHTSHRLETRMVAAKYLENLLRIIDDPREHARAHLALADLYWKDENPYRRQRAGEALAQARGLDLPVSDRTTVLQQSARWAAEAGAPEFTSNGEMTLAPDYPTALAFLREIVRIAEDAEVIASAEATIESIEEPRLHLLAPFAFSPGAEAALLVHGRNNPQVTIEFFRADPLEHLAPQSATRGFDAHLRLPETLEPVHTQTLDLVPAAAHRTVREVVRLDAELPAGLYQVRASGREEKHPTALLLVTSLVCSLQVDNGKVLAHVADANSGAPVPNAELACWYDPMEGERPDRKRPWHRLKGTTDRHGIARFQLPATVNPIDGHQVLLAARSGDAVALVGGRFLDRRRDEATQLQTLFFVDRPLYRPADTVHWKVFAREVSANDAAIPGGRTLRAEFADADGEILHTSDSGLDANGTAHGSFELPPAPALGWVDVTFCLIGPDGERTACDGSSSFSIDAYRPNRYKVEIVFDGEEADAPPSAPGEPLRGEVRLQFYSGPPVANAQVDLEVGFYPRDDRFEGEDHEALAGSVLDCQTHTLATNAQGIARFEVPTPRAINGPLSAHFRASVVDPSHREVTAKRWLNFARQSHTVDLLRSTALTTPAEPIDLTVVARDRYHRPATVTGRLRIVRDTWRETYLHRRTGRIIDGERYRELPDRSLMGATKSDYALDEAAYTSTEVTAAVLTTSDGSATFHFQPSLPGRYRVLWSSRDPYGPPVQAQARFLVASETSQEIGFRPENGKAIQLLIDTRSAVTGDRVRLLICTDAPGRHVLLTIRGRETTARSILIEGTCKLITFEAGPDLVPNCVVLATTRADGEWHSDGIDFPASSADNRLNVALAPDTSSLAPAEQASVTITTSDASGAPEPAEIALAVVDEAIFALQPWDYATWLLNWPRRPPRYEGFPDAPRLALSTQGFPFFSTDAEWPEGNAPPLDPFQRIAVEGTEDDEITTALAASGVPEAELDDKTSVTFVADDPGSQRPAPPHLRTDFSPTAFWAPDLQSDDDGHTRATFTLPDSLTQWRATALAMSRDGEAFGTASTHLRTRLPLRARLNAPRFLVAGDVITIEGIIDNSTETALSGSARLDVGAALELLDANAREISIPSEQSTRLQWRARVLNAGAATLTLTASCGAHGDALERTLPVLPVGIEQLTVSAGTLDPGTTQQELSLPEEREGTQVALRISPGFSNIVADALPYLIDYPYGCTEQTLSRFVPAVIARASLQRLGLDARAIASRALPDHNAPISALDEIIADGLARLYQLQHEDGAWGWWQHGEADPYLTAYAYHSLCSLAATGQELDADRLDRARKRLLEILPTVDDPPLRVWMLHALAARLEQTPGAPSKAEVEAFLELLQARSLPPPGVALLAIVAHRYDLPEESATLLERLLARAVQHPDGSLAWPGFRQQRSRFAANSTEATAFALLALLLCGREEAAAKAALRLALSRTDGRWEHTRATALACLALTAYSDAHDALARPRNFRLAWNGTAAASGQLSTLAEPLVVDPARVEASNTFAITLDQDAPLAFYNLSARYHASAVPPPAAGVSLTRTYAVARNVPTLLGGGREVLRPLDASTTLEAGDRLETTLRIALDTPARYILVEAPLASGGELGSNLASERLLLRERSSGATHHARAEYHDDKLVLFVDYLDAGDWEFTFRQRLAHAGTLQVRPGVVYPMYDPLRRAYAPASVLDVIAPQPEAAQATAP